jgi:hypothetical protein
MTCLQNIQLSLDEFEKHPHMNFFAKNLLRNMALFLISKESTEGQCKPALQSPGIVHDPNETFITIFAFYDEYHLCTPGAISSQFRTDLRFFEWCGKREGHKYLIQPKNALRFLSVYGSPKLKKRALKILDKDPFSREEQIALC